MIWLQQDKAQPDGSLACVVILRTCNRMLLHARHAFAGVYGKKLSCVAELQPDSGGFAQKLHTRAVSKWMTLACALCTRWPLALMAMGVAIVFVAAAFDLRVKTTESMPLGLFYEAPPRLQRGGGMDRSELRTVELEALLRALGQRSPVDPSRLASALLDSLGRSPDRDAVE